MEVSIECRECKGVGFTASIACTVCGGTGWETAYPIEKLTSTNLSGTDTVGHEPIPNGTDLHGGQEPDTE